ncbi:MAG TPA: hypothetical protein VGG97_03370 [Bryobacteraceae bacterium]|jgi:hypothetical protein
MSLRPAATTQKILISTTSRLIGEFERPDALITHAWHPFDSHARLKMQEGPLSRNAYVFAFETEPIERRPGVVVPDHSYVGDWICSRLAVLYGKRFDNHGVIENQGHFHIPEFSLFAEMCNHHLPQNSHSVRSNYPVPLNLSEVSRIEALIFESGLEPTFQQRFDAAAKFYLRALQFAETDPEVAYLNLVTVGEVLSGSYEYDKEALLDDETRDALDKIRANCTDGTRIASLISGKLLLIKRRFIEALVDACDGGFFAKHETTEDFGALQASSFREVVAAAYDLRSQYVHTGASFGARISANSNPFEIAVGIPVMDNMKLAKLISKAPTYRGMERIIRYALLRFAESNGGYRATHTIEDVRSQPNESRSSSES